MKKFTPAQLEAVLQKEKRALIDDLPLSGYKIGDVVVAETEGRIEQWRCVAAVLLGKEWVYTWDNGSGLKAEMSGAFFNILKIL